MKISYEKIPAVKIEVEIEGGVAEYAKAFLNIFNNVRESGQDELLKVSNAYGSNSICVTAHADEEESTVKWLSAFGTIKEVEHLTAFQPYVDTIPEAEEDEVFEGEYLELKLW